MKPLTIAQRLIVLAALVTQPMPHRMTLSSMEKHTRRQLQLIRILLLSTAIWQSRPKRLQAVLQLSVITTIRWLITTKNSQLCIRLQNNRHEAHRRTHRLTNLSTV